MELIQTPTKRQEVWRKPDGTFGKAPEPVVEPDQDVKKNDSGIILASTLLGSAGIMLAVVFWKVSLSIAAGGGIVYLAQRFLKDRQNREALIVNQDGTSTTIYL